MHVAAAVERAVLSLPKDQQASAGVQLVDDVIRRLDSLRPRIGLADEVPVRGGELLRAVLPRNPDGTPDVIDEPLIPLLDTTLLTNAPGEPGLGKQLPAEIASADRIDVVMAFIRRSGIRPLLDAAAPAAPRAGRRLRVLTTTYTGSTERRALDELAASGPTCGSRTTRHTRLHAKAWLFHRRVGVLDGLHRLVEPHPLGAGGRARVERAGRRPATPTWWRRCRRRSTAYWESGDFRPTTRRSSTGRRRPAQHRHGPTVLSPIELRPEPFQERLLEQIAVARAAGPSPQPAGVGHRHRQDRDGGAGLRAPARPTAAGPAAVRRPPPGDPRPEPGDVPPRPARAGVRRAVGGRRSPDAASSTCSRRSRA